MRRCLFALLCLALSFALCDAVRAAEPRLAMAVLARGPLAGTRLYVSLDGRVLPGDNAATGASGRVVSLDGGRTWLYQDAGGATGEVAALDPLPTHLHRLSSVVSHLRALARRGGIITAAELAQPTLAELAEAEDAWRAQGGAALRRPEVQQALQELEQVRRAIQHAAVGTDEDVAEAFQAVLPRLHAITAVALAQPRDGVTVTVKQSAIDFGVVQVGSSTPMSIGLSTNSDQEVEVAVDTTGLTAPFSASGGPTVSVLKASGGSLQITFAPTAAGDFQGQVVLTHPGLPGGKVTVPVKGSARTEKLVVEPTKLDFGTVVVGSSNTLTLKVVNNSTQSAKIRTDFQISGEPFSTGAPADVNGTFQPHEPATINITFSPKKDGVFGASAVVTSSQMPGVKIQVSFKGTALSIVTVAPSPLNFGPVKVGASAAGGFTVTNNTSQPQPLTCKVISAGFSLGDVPATVPANGSVTVPVTFSPTGEHAYEGLVHVVAGVKPHKYKQDVVLLGEGKKATLTGLTLSKDKVAFGTVPKNTQGTQSFTITNNTKAAKTVTLDTSGLNSTFFHVQEGTSFTINPGAAQTVTITFFATGVCNHHDKIVVQSDGGSEEIPVTAAAK